MNSADSKIETVHDEVRVLCELVHVIRAWWEAFEDTVRQLDQTAACKAYDAIIAATIAARRIARELGLEIPDFSDIQWTALAAPAGHAVGVDDI